MKTFTVEHTLPGIVQDETEYGTTVLVGPGTYPVVSDDKDYSNLLYLDVPPFDHAVVVMTDWYGGGDTEPMPLTRVSPLG